MAKNKLTLRQLKFVENFSRGMKKGEAAAAAGYSAHTAANIASGLLKQEHVLSAIRTAAEKQINAGVAIGARILTELAESAKSEDVKLRAATALLDRGGLPLIRQSEVRHTLEDRRTDAELLAHVKSLAAALNVPLPAGVVDAEFTEAPRPALPTPAVDPFSDD